MKSVSREKAMRHRVRSEIHYFDDFNNPVPRDNATWAVVRDIDEQGGVILEVQGYVE